MKKLEDLEAYEIIESHKSEDLDSMCYLLRHKKTHARITVISNNDENKVFYVGFRTPPKDSTGVAHIIEHTVLCGSEKYPLKDPFMELEKGSLSTFLNAMTYPDKTVYPVADCNDKDFRNLMDVYLDAVFHPNIYREEKIFRQEGWHYEMESADDELKINGVVYNEMKGVYSSPDDIFERRIVDSLFPDNAYGVESGGDPKHIPDLTYEDYLSFHKKYYHPSNSYIYFYGNSDMADQLEYIDREYLSHYDLLNVDSEIYAQKPFESPREIKDFYPITDNEKEENNTYYAYSAAMHDNLDPEKYVAFQVIDYALCSAPGAPVKDALIKAGIGQDVYGIYENGICQPYYSIVAHGASEGQKEEFVKIIDDTLERIASEGLNPKSIAAAINYYEFRYREADYGSYPKGLIWGLSLLDSWLYDDSRPFIHVEENKTFERLKKEIGTGYFEGLIKDGLIGNPHKSIFVMSPKKGLNLEMEKEEKERLRVLKDSLNREEIEKIVSDTAALKAYQQEPEKPENIEKIPFLKREDIKKISDPLINDPGKIGDTDVLYHPIFTNGIAYLDLLFDMKDIPERLMPYVSLVKEFIGLIGTERYTYGELFNEINIHTGGITTNVTTFTDLRNGIDFRKMFEVKARVLYSELPAAFDIIKEMTEKTVWSDTERLRELISEIKSQKESSLCCSGHTAAAGRALSYQSAVSMFMDQMNGIAYYRFLDKVDKTFDECKDELAESLAESCIYIFRPENISVDLTAEKDHIRDIDELVPAYKKTLFTDAVEREAYIPVPEKKNEGFKTAGKIQFVCCAGNFRKKGLQYNGTLSVLKTIMSLDYLWNNIRVLGGAYGCMCDFRRSGDSFFVSYRDPNLAKTVDVYKKAAEAVRKFDADDRTMTKFIIGTMSRIDNPMTPSEKGANSMSAYMTHHSYEQIQKERDEILGAQPSDIRALGEYIDKFMNDDCLCVIGSEQSIDECRKMFGKTEFLIG